MGLNFYPHVLFYMLTMVVILLLLKPIITIRQKSKLVTNFVILSKQDEIIEQQPYLSKMDTYGRRWLQLEKNKWVVMPDKLKIKFKYVFHLSVEGIEILIKMIKESDWVALKKQIDNQTPHRKVKDEHKFK
ncbi:hypothetical protein LCGC14_0176390 [marine sediment metagenome]|uniref:Uncharacterized protein n=1 Tax=marine sediment metagenome TaxID=412755 RepID=A0A0F9URP6_9ZZZZ